MEWGSSQRTPQTIDDGCRVMDHLFVGLFATPHLKDDGSGNPEYYTFQYRLFSSRQLYLLSTGGTTLGKNKDTFPLPNPGGVMGPITLEYLKGIVVAWRIGTVMDESLVRHPEKQVLLNVVVEEWTYQKLTAHYLIREPSVEEYNGSLQVGHPEIDAARPYLLGPIAELHAFVQTVPKKYNKNTIPVIEAAFENWQEEFKKNKNTAPDDKVVELFRWLWGVIYGDSTDKLTKNILQTYTVINIPNVKLAQTVASLKQDIYNTLVEADKIFFNKCVLFVEQVGVYSFLGDFWKESRGRNEWKLVLQDIIET